MQIHLHELKILQIHNARPEFKKKNITVINQSVALFTKILTIKNCRKCKTKIKKSFTKYLR